jgi:outer membrane protein assembly factor BamD
MTRVAILLLLALVVYLALGIGSEAQSAVAVLERKFPNGPWLAGAEAALKAAALAPAEDAASWISRAVK